MQLETFGRKHISVSLNCTNESLCLHPCLWKRICASIRVLYVVEGNFDGRNPLSPQFVNFPPHCLDKVNEEQALRVQCG